jgi:hypothetical protein
MCPGVGSATNPPFRQIAIRTFADFSDARPGFLEMDLVAHCGWSGAGQFLYTLSMVDVATG